MNAFESPINNTQQLMAITAEECAELTQVCMKVMRIFDDKEQIKDSAWRESLIEELGDVQCMIDLMIEHDIVNHIQITNRALVKREKLKTWSTLVNDDV